jgi:hypothetical protein
MESTKRNLMQEAQRRWGQVEVMSASAGERMRALNERPAPTFVPPRSGVRATFGEPRRVSPVTEQRRDVSAYQLETAGVR